MGSQPRAWLWFVTMLMHLSECDFPELNTQSCRIPAGRVTCSHLWWRTVTGAGSVPSAPSVPLWGSSRPWAPGEGHRTASATSEAITKQSSICRSAPSGTKGSSCLPAETKSLRLGCHRKDKSRHNRVSALTWAKSTPRASKCLWPLAASVAPRGCCDRNGAHSSSAGTRELRPGPEGARACAVPGAVVPEPLPCHSWCFSPCLGQGHSCSSAWRDSQPRCLLLSLFLPSSPLCLSAVDNSASLLPPQSAGPGSWELGGEKEEDEEEKEEEDDCDDDGD